VESIPRNWDASYPGAKRNKKRNLVLCEEMLRRNGANKETAIRLRREKKRKLAGEPRPRRVARDQIKGKKVTAIGAREGL